MTQTIQQPEQKSKRDFLKYLLGGSALAALANILYPIIAYVQPPKQGEVEVKSVKAGKIGDFETNSGTIIRFGNKPVILIRKSNGEFRAFTATCTHLDCTVQFRKDLDIIWCACHNGKYDLTGRNIDGPPPRPLEEFRVVIQAEEIFISKKV
jgi:Rieske Fe-S protein